MVISNAVPTVAPSIFVASGPILLLVPAARNAGASKVARPTATTRAF